MMKLSQLSTAVNGRLIGADAEFSSVSTDTRAMLPGTLFVALEGPNFDGHDFLPAAKAARAVAALVNKPQELDLPQVVVDSTRAALGQLAAYWRNRFDIPLVGITGSNGKTTVKEMTAAILSQRGAVAVTAGNKNNDIGVPLTLLSIRDGHRCAVVEMGANHPGEIAYLSGLARPTVAVITNAAPAHLKGFGSIAGVVQAKGEILGALQSDGVAVLNADDPHFDEWRKLRGVGATISFGFTAGADLRGRDVRSDALGGSSFTLSSREHTARITLPVPGEHNVRNALAASAVALSLGISIEEIRTGLAAFRAVAGRLQVLHRGALRIIDDTYNANPASLRAALDVITAAPERKVLVLGDMGELGEQGHSYHRDAGQQAYAAGVEALFSIGELGAEAAAAFGAGACHFKSVDDLIAGLKGLLSDEVPTAVLVKGSRSMRMERVVEALTDDSRMSKGDSGGASRTVSSGSSGMVH